MGQQIGKVELVPNAVPFTNLSSEGVLALWTAFLDIAEQFGIDLETFTDICSVVRKELSPPGGELADEEFNELCSAVFKALDTDENDLVDALEVGPRQPTLLSILLFCSALLCSAFPHSPLLGSARLSAPLLPSPPLRSSLRTWKQFLATFALISSMSFREKVEFAFECYDFNDNHEITVDEMTLAMKSTITGLSKLAGIVPPSELELEDMANDAFEQA